MQFFDKLRGGSFKCVDLRFSSEAMQEFRQGCAGWRVFSSDKVSPLRDSQAIARGSPQKESTEPVRKVYAQDKEMAVSKLREQPFRRRDVATDEAVNKLELVFIVNGKVGLARGATEKIEHN